MSIHDMVKVRGNPDFLSSQYTMLHDSIIKWEHFPRYWPFVLGIHQLLVNSPHSAHDNAVPLAKYARFCRCTQNMNAISNNCVYSASHSRPGLHFQNV